MDASFIWPKALKFQGLFEIDLHQIGVGSLSKELKI